MSGLDCPVCMEIFLDPVTIPCGHTLCKDCLYSLALSITKFCPICRQPIPAHAAQSFVNFSLKQVIQEHHKDRLAERQQRRHPIQPGTYSAFCIKYDPSQMELPMPYINSKVSLLRPFPDNWAEENNPTLIFVVELPKRGVLGRVIKSEGTQLVFRGESLVTVTEQAEVEGQPFPYCRYTVLHEQAPRISAFERLDNLIFRYLQAQNRRAPYQQMVIERCGKPIWQCPNPVQKMWGYCAVLHLEREQLRRSLVDELSCEDRVDFLSSLPMHEQLGAAELSQRLVLRAPRTSRVPQFELLFILALLVASALARRYLF